MALRKLAAELRANQAEIHTLVLGKDWCVRWAPSIRSLPYKKQLLAPFHFTRDGCCTLHLPTPHCCNVAVWIQSLTVWSGR
jgi:hypothetical protein